MHSRVRQIPDRLLRPFGAVLIMLALVLPLASVQPAPAAAQDEDATGTLSELWSYEASDSLFGDPGVTNGVVLVASEDSVIHAVDSETGEALWQSSTLYLTSGPYMQVADGLLLALSDEPLSLNAFDVSPDGAEERWSVELDTVPQSWLPTVTDDGLVIVLLESDSGGDGRIVAFDRDDGSEQWSVELTGFIYATGYLYSDGVVVVGTPEGIAGLDVASGDELWSTELEAPTTKLLAGDGAIFGATREDDDLFALDITSGDELWRVDAPTTSNLPFTYGDGLFFVSYYQEIDDEDGRAILALDAETGEERYTILSATGELTTGIVQDGRLHVAADSSMSQEGALEVYNLDDGSLIARTELVAMGMALDGDSIFIASFGTDQSLLYGYRLDDGGSGNDDGSDNDAGSDSDDDTPPVSGDDALDIAAMSLTPWDLADAGLDNYGHNFSEMVFIGAFAATLAADRDMDAADIRDELEAAGFIRAYYAYFYSPADEEETDQLVVSYVLEFADAEGAGEAWEFLEDESDQDDAEDLDGFDDLGDASEATLLTGEVPASGDPFVQIDTTVLIDNLHAGVSVIDWTGEEPDEELVIDLIDYTLERVEDGFDAGQPALSNQVVRVSGDTVSNYHDTYLLRDGEAIWFTDETPDTADAQLDAAEDGGWTEEYRVWQYLASLSDDPADSVWSYISLLRFEDEEAAAAWLDERQRVTEEDDRYSEVEFDDAAYGDAGFTYTALFEDGTITNRGITFQLGEIVATIDVSAPAEPSAEAIAAIADEQLACLEDGGCLDPIGMPQAVEEFIADAGEGAGADDDETPEAEEDETEEADGGPVLYESALYDFSIAFNANDWQFTPEEDPTDDEYEWIRFDNDASSVWMVADPDFGSDELSDCVEHYVVELGWADAWELEPLDELSEDNGRVYVSYTLSNSLLSISAYLSVECRSIDDDTALMITHYADTEEEGEVPEDEIELVQELTAGIEISGSTEDTGDTVDEDSEDEEGSASAGESYTSDDWGYTVTWDPEYWSESGAGLEDGIRLGFRTNSLASVTIFAVEGDQADPDACLEASIEDDGEGSDLEAADDLPAPELADNAVGGVYMLGDFGTLYFECRPLVEGEAALRIAFGGPDENWEELLPYLEDILAGIVIPEGAD